MTEPNTGPGLVGAWSLVSFESRISTGEVRRPLGENAGGMLIYTADGHMAGTLWEPDRPRFAGDDQRSGTPDEYTAAARGYVQYTGTYETDAATNAVYHHVEQSLFPNWNGRTLTRFYEFADGGNSVTLRTAPIPYDGETITGMLVWRRR
ncbi:lipocalin-like protein [Herbihabitans rhizosphaerae]|uniref:Lipocalin-like protein n=1 Tax=Herbihabitans rhizosphaerae TaxID=1872711 RepID=A0A4Q7KJ13_9PSEU|nr:lipocalin-like domain-containing protein [Herbihabitans rhizosphaerae]RZS36405.1 lipocalin-like protein [Herbihabitans rhizosphaerae]